MEFNPDSQFFIEYKCKTLLGLGLTDELIEELNKGALKHLYFKEIFLLELCKNHIITNREFVIYIKEVKIRI